MRKSADGPIRNKERTKNKILDSLGEIIASEGFSKLTVMKIARKAGVDKKLIYKYWGGFDGVVKAYLDSKPFWETSPQEDNSNTPDFGKDIIHQFLEKQFDSLINNAEMCGIIAGKLNGDIKPLKELDQKQEKWREEFFKKMPDEHSDKDDNNLRAIGAILMGGIYHLTLNTHKNNGQFCGIDMKEEKGQQEIKKALRQIIESTYHK